MVAKVLSLSDWSQLIFTSLESLFCFIKLLLCSHIFHIRLLFILSEFNLSPYRLLLILLHKTPVCYIIFFLCIRLKSNSYLLLYWSPIIIISDRSQFNYIGVFIWYIKLLLYWVYIRLILLSEFNLSLYRLLLILLY